MNITVLGDSLESFALRRRLVLEDDTLVEGADVVVDKEFYHREVPKAIVEATFERAIGLRDPATHYLVRYWHGGWHKQTAVGVVLTGTMNEDLGADVAVGSAWRFGIVANEEVFYNPTLVGMLGQTGFRGFVSVGVGEEGPVSLATGLPGYGVFGLLESVTTRLSSFLEHPHECRLQERWYGSLLVSRAPFPVEATDRVLVENVHPGVERHFWAFAPGGVMKQSFYSIHSRLGVATAWGRTVWEIASRVTQTARNIGCKGKQFRTDFEKAILARWSKANEALVLGRMSR